MTKQQIQSMLNDGMNLNQIAAIYMVSKVELEQILVTPDQKIKKVEDKPLFEDEPGL
jgi:hypothetical protein